MRRSPAVRRLVSLRPSVIEAGDPYTLAWAALAAGDELGVPVVAFCHSDLPRLIGRRYGRRAERLASLYCARLYRRFDLVLAPSAMMTARLRAWGVRQAVHQPLGVDAGLFNPRRRDPRFRQKIGVAANARLLVFAGRFAPEKNLHVLADAMRSLDSRYVAVLVGAGRAPTNLPANVRVLPYVSGRQALATLLASCDAFVHPGDQETFGLAALEAMACGLPVIGAGAAGIGELVTPDVGVLTEPGKPSALADGIVRMFRSDVAGMAARARRLAEQYAWPAVLESVIGRYSALARQAPAH
jgi:alpha-1,6-mannosyltransferase